MTDINFNVVKSNHGKKSAHSVLCINKTKSFKLNRINYYHDACIISTNHKCLIRFRVISIRKILDE